MRAAHKSDVGKIRPINEDRAAVNLGLNGWTVAIVADGMGGHQAGDIASQIAIDVIQNELQTLSSELSLNECEQRIRDAIRAANRAIFEQSQLDIKHRGMGTTVVACAATENHIILSHIGDSRAYLISSNGEIRQLTEDHSLVNELVKSGQITKEEADHHPRRNVLTQALGTELDIHIESSVVNWTENEQLMLCSDGLSNMVTLDQMKAILLSHESPEWKVDQLIEQALESGGDDNITVVILANEQSGQGEGVK